MAKKSNGAKPVRYLVGADGMTLLRYNGSSTWVWFTGLVTNAKYPFGTKRRLGLVDAHDAGAGPECTGKLLAEREDDRLVFEAVD